MLSLRIVSPNHFCTYEVVWIEANTPEGNFIIQPEHAPTTLILSEHKPFIFCLPTGKTETIIPEKNVLLQVTRTSAVVLL